MIATTKTFLVHFIAIAAAVQGIAGDNRILDTYATIRADNVLIVDIHVTTGEHAAKLSVTYQTPGVDPLVSPFAAVSSTGSTTITVGRLRANRTYTYTVRALDEYGAPAGTVRGTSPRVRYLRPSRRILIPSTAEALCR